MVASAHGLLKRFNPVILKAFASKAFNIFLTNKGSYSSNILLILFELRKQGIHIGYLFLVLFISFNFYLHRDDGPFNPCNEVRHSLFSSGISGADLVSIQKDGFSQNSSVPQKKKFKIRTRYKAADEIEIVFVAPFEEPVPDFLVLRHTPILPNLLPGSMHLDLNLRGPPMI